MVLAGLDLLVHEHVLGREAAELLAVLALDGLEEHLGGAVRLLPLQHLQVAAVDQCVQRQRDLLAVDAIARELAADARLRQALGVLVAQPVQQVAQVCHSPLSLTFSTFQRSYKKKKQRGRRIERESVSQSLNQKTKHNLNKKQTQMQGCRGART